MTGSNAGYFIHLLTPGLMSRSKTATAGQFLRSWVRCSLSLVEAVGREVVIWRISRCLDSNICWNSGRKYSNGGFVALARPTQRAASVRGKRGKIFCFENLNFYSWNDYFKHLAHGLGWLVSFQFVFPKFSKLGVFRVIWCIPPARVHPWQNI